MQSRLASAFTAALLFPCALAASRAQTPAPSNAAAPLAFDVVSVKENPGPDCKFMGVMDHPDGLDANESLEGFVADAFGMRRELVSCKLPLCDKPLFEIRAKLPPEDQARFAKLTWQEKAALLQPILKDRFGLQVHTETRPTNVYELVVAKGGPRFLGPPPPDQPGALGAPPAGTVWLMKGQFRGSGIKLSGFVSMLSQFEGDSLGRPVIDKTGLTGTYDLSLKWSDPVHDSASTGSSSTPDPAEQNPGIFAALPEQLGLELKPAREPEPILVVDQAHTPTPD